MTWFLIINVASVKLHFLQFAILRFDTLDWRR